MQGKLLPLMLTLSAGPSLAACVTLPFSSGLIDFQSVLDTQRTMPAVAESLPSTRSERVLALIRIYKALGGGWSSGTETAPAGKDSP